MDRYVLVIATWGVSAAVQAGSLTIGYRVGGGSGVTYVHHVSEDAFRVALGRFDMIMHAGSEKVVHVNNEEKTYRELDAKDMEGPRALARGPKQPETIGKEAYATFGGEKTVVAGYAAERYDITLGPDSLEAWVAPGLARPAHYLNSWRACQLSPSPFADFAEKAVAALESIDGMPLLLRWNVTVMGHPMKTEMRALEVRAGDLPASIFQPPAGFAKVDARARPKSSSLPPEAAAGAK